MSDEFGRRRWLAPKRFGYGWRPVTWQGWAISLLPLVVVLIVLMAR